MKNEDINKKKVKKNNSNKESKKVKVEVIEENTSIEESNIVREGSNKKNKGDLFLVLGLDLGGIFGFIVMRDVNAGPNY